MAQVIERRSELVTVTPMMKQYLEVKADYEDFILLYRLGDFYECFFDDALIASRELELTLTSRDCGEGNRGAMCGVPFHKADTYIGRLVDKGYKVAVCEQVEDPKAATGLVKREVVRVVTPGTVTDAGLLQEGRNNYLAAVCYGKGEIALSLADISTGEVSSTVFSGADAAIRLENEIGAYQPSEVIINVPKEECESLVRFVKERYNSLVNDNQRRLFAYDKSRELVSSVFSEGREISSPEMTMSLGALISYIRETQKTTVTFTGGLNIYSGGQYLELDINTRRNLEICETMRTKEKRGSLLWVLDKTSTAMGARMLRSWLTKPLLNPVEIIKRQNVVRDLTKNRALYEDIARHLSVMLDLERLTAKAVYGSANARDLLAIARSIEALPTVKELILASDCRYLCELISGLDTLTDLYNLLSRALSDNPPLTVREGGMIREGFNTDVDYFRSIKNGGEEIMASIEEKEKNDTGIRTLKVSYNKVFGYYIEVSKSFIDQVPDRYVRKQTLTNCERYITSELKEMETTIFNADDNLSALEYELFMGLCSVVSENNARIRATAALIAELDVYCSLAEVADRNGYVCPDVHTGFELVIKDGRHPVVEKFVSDSYFVPNDTTLDVSDNRLMIITGPNMAGKSTYMRQVAVITLMAQIGSFVPAKEASIGIVDKIFTRVGASDDLASGQSTFMLEMNEVALIFKNATERSLIIYDEVGRGTSTYDGMAIARAVIEYTHSKKIGAKTLFATHYHELTDMEESFEGIVNYNIAAKKRGEGITFLRKIVRGGTDDSYGIEVAKLAGVPSEVIKRAREILADIEKGAPRTAVSEKRADSFDLFSSIEHSKEGEAADRIRNADLNTLTPIEAMNMLFELKKIISD